MVVLKFSNIDNHEFVYVNPSQTMIDAVCYFNPTGMLKVYDFRTCEIVTFKVENFTWIELSSHINERLNCFSA